MSQKSRNISAGADLVQVMSAVQGVLLLSSVACSDQSL
jgi:hypothetical protein